MGAAWRASELAGRASEPAERALEPVGRGLELVGKGSDPAGRGLELSGRASEPALRASEEPAGRVSGPAGRVDIGASWQARRGRGRRMKKERKKGAFPHMRWYHRSSSPTGVLPKNQVVIVVMVVIDPWPGGKRGLCSVACMQ